MNKIAYSIFVKRYKDQHKDIQSTKINIAKSNEEWMKLRTKHNLLQSKCNHKIPACQWPSQFHTEALLLVQKWKLEQWQRSTAAQTAFFSLYKNSKSKSKPNRKRKRKESVLSDFNCLCWPSSQTTLPTESPTVSPFNEPKRKKIIMRVESRTICDDHDFVKASRYKILCSVCQSLPMTNQCCSAPEAVSNIGDTFIVCRSGKHDSSTATSHYDDINAMFKHPDFKEVLRDKSGNPKPVQFDRSDGGPAENVKNVKTVIYHCLRFTHCKLEFFCASISAPKQSAYNPVERIMNHIIAWLKRHVLDPVQYGYPLNSQQQTIDKDAESYNFKQCGIDLVNSTQRQKVKSHIVRAKCAKPQKDESYRDTQIIQSSVKEFHIFLKNHARFGSYTFELVSCLHPNDPCSVCNKQLRSQCFDLVRDATMHPFSPLYVPTSRDNGRLVAAKPCSKMSSHAHYSSFMASNKYKINGPCYDVFCGQFNGKRVGERCCKHCHMFFPSLFWCLTRR